MHLQNKEFQRIREVPQETPFSTNNYGIFKLCWRFLDHYFIWSFTFLLFEVGTIGDVRHAHRKTVIFSSYWSVSVPNPGGGQQIQSMIIHRGLWKRCETAQSGLGSQCDSYYLPINQDRLMKPMIHSLWTIGYEYEL